jgi:hypothetical protein
LERCPDPKLVDRVKLEDFSTSESALIH